ncbi:Lipoprotein releasing system ATP-binding protein LolD [hydrothermal vent metagenome]|uniref:Lipoprotein releasing system ATP-binding protein LolD n=1 Tax=hydrothermal vent metagenome TaxID=652676 RepID=A0A3B1E119_9ZZZZ
MIEIKEVTKTYQRGQTEVHALRGASCCIPENTFTFIVGPSGSGKSSLLYLLGALDQPTSGDLTVQGVSLATMTEPQRNEYRRKKVGFIFQNYNLLKNMSAVENVLVPFLPMGIMPAMQQRAIDLLSDVGLKERLDHKPAQLSGGEQQRVAIARALLKEPQLILADEPTGELDSQTGAEVFSYLRKMHQTGKTTVIVVTHDERYITPNDTIIRLQDGQVKEIISPPV